MKFFAFGLNHETATVNVRECFALDESDTRALYRTLTLSDDAELILLSTCNRTEVYLYGTDEDVATVRATLQRATEQAWSEAHAFLCEDEAAIRHVLHVTSGIRSQVLGDVQILAQVKEAYRLAVEEDGVGTVMHRLMHTAFRTAKRVINETALTDGTASIATAAVAAVRTHFSEVPGADLERRKVLLVGTGQMGQLSLDALRSYRPAGIAVTNRSPERALAVADDTGAVVIPWEDRYDAIAESDVVVVATGAAEPVLWASEMPHRTREGQPTLLVDIAMPRNVDPAIDDVPGYRVVDLDALHDTTERVERQRRAEVPKVEHICEEELNEYVAWVFHHEALQPTIHAVRDTFEHIRRQEIERHHHRFSDLDRQELDELTRSIMQKLLAVPIVRLKSVDPESIDFVRGIRLLHALFSRPDCDDAEATTPTTSVPRLADKPAPLDDPQLCPFDEQEGDASSPAVVDAMRLLTETLRHGRPAGGDRDQG